jgi:hypothetical protein
MVTTGCTIFTNTSTAQLRAQPYETATFKIAAPYAVVLPQYFAAAQHCYPGAGTVGGGYSIAQLNETVAGHSATVEIVADGTLATKVMLSSDVVADGDSTAITYYVSGWIDYPHNMAPLLEAWASGDSSKCSP